MSVNPGQTLKAAREQRGLTLLDAAHVTRITPQQLQHLENDNYAAFGSMTYARSFLRIYGRYLEVEVGDILEELPGAVLGGARDYRYLTDNYGHWVPPRSPGAGSLSTPRLRRPPRRSPVPAGLTIFVLLVAGTGIWGRYVAEVNAAGSGSPAPVPATATQPETPAAPAARPVERPARASATAAPAARQPQKILRAIPITEEERRKLLPKGDGNLPQL